MTKGFRWLLGDLRETEKMNLMSQIAISSSEAPIRRL